MPLEWTFNNTRIPQVLNLDNSFRKFFFIQQILDTSKNYTIWIVEIDDELKNSNTIIDNLTKKFSSLRSLYLYLAEPINIDMKYSYSKFIFDFQYFYTELYYRTFYSKINWYTSEHLWLINILAKYYSKFLIDNPFLYPTFYWKFINTLFKESLINFWLLLPDKSFFLLFSLFIMCLWGLDIKQESELSNHNSIVSLGLWIGFVLFLVSEIMFFFSFFWAFFHFTLNPHPYMFCFWPPQGTYLESYRLKPLFNTIILITSGVTVGLSHSAVK